MTSDRHSERERRICFAFSSSVSDLRDCHAALHRWSLAESCSYQRFTLGYSSNFTWWPSWRPTQVYVAISAIEYSPARYSCCASSYRARCKALALPCEIVRWHREFFPRDGRNNSPDRTSARRRPSETSAIESPYSAAPCRRARACRISPPIHQDRAGLEQA